jgi:hypothetical protein
MSDQITIRCATCGYEIGEITFVPGFQVIGCKRCSGATWVEITKDGEVNTGQRTVGSIPKDYDDD